MSSEPNSDVQQVEMVVAWVHLSWKHNKNLKGSDMYFRWGIQIKGLLCLNNIWKWYILIVPEELILSEFKTVPKESA